MPRVVSWICQILAGVILAMAAYGKFTGSEESIYVFNSLGMADTGRLVIAVIEGLAAIMLLTPVIPHLGALLGFGTMLGALIAHVTKLGISIHGDGGEMLCMMILVMLTTLVIMFIHRKKMPLIGHTYS